MDRIQGLWRDPDFEAGVDALWEDVNDPPAEDEIQYPEAEWRSLSDVYSTLTLEVVASSRTDNAVQGEFPALTFDMRVICLIF